MEAEEGGVEGGEEPEGVEGVKGVGGGLRWGGRAEEGLRGSRQLWGLRGGEAAQKGVDGQKGSKG